MCGGQNCAIIQELQVIDRPRPHESVPCRLTSKGEGENKQREADNDEAGDEDTQDEQGDGQEVQQTST